MMNESPSAECPAPCCGGESPGHAGGADLFGMACSLACAVHCAAMPLVIAAAPAVGGSWLGGEAVHFVLLPICAAAAAWSMRPGLRRHGRRSPTALAVCGVALLGAAVALPPLLAGPGETAGAAEPVGCAAACCAVPPPAPAVAEPPIRHATRLALPWLTPAGGGLLVVAHLWNLLAPPRRRLGETLPSAPLMPQAL